LGSWYVFFNFFHLFSHYLYIFRYYLSASLCDKSTTMMNELEGGNKAQNASFASNDAFWAVGTFFQMFSFVFSLLTTFLDSRHDYYWVRRVDDDDERVGRWKQDPKRVWRVLGCW
jgi:hypothetical protein